MDYAKEDSMDEESFVVFSFSSFPSVYWEKGG